MKFCTECGKELADDTKFCIICGARQPQANVNNQANQQAPANMNNGVQPQVPANMNNVVQSQAPANMNNGVKPQESANMNNIAKPAAPVDMKKQAEKAAKNAKNATKVNFLNTLGGKIAVGVLGVAVVGGIATGIILNNSANKKDNNNSKDNATELVVDATDQMTEDNTGDVATVVDASEQGDTTEEAVEATEEPVSFNIEAMERNMIMKGAQSIANKELVPSVPAYEVAEDLSNIINPHDIANLPDDFKQKLVNNKFVVGKGYYDEFFEIYENNRYFYVPNFVTVDSMMHTYHLYFSYLLKNTEKSYLSDTVSTLGQSMLEQSISQYNSLIGTEWEAAAKRNVAFFAVGCKLQGNEAEVLDEVSEVVEAELSKIDAASGIDASPLFSTDDEPYYEDYSQYKPRGYYEGDAQLEQYFKTMMWYGRINFTGTSEELTRSAVLMTLAMKGDNYSQWDSIYTITSFFAGASDDNGYCEYLPVIDAVYGSNITVSDLVGRDSDWENLRKALESLGKPQINSIVIEDEGTDDDEHNVIPGFRFMGQRFSVDAAVMQKLIYSDVGENENGDKRMLPDTLDVPAALGSNTAFSILEAQGATGYSGYTDNMDKLRQQYNTDNETLWSASLYANWLNTLRPLLDEKPEGYPSFMLSEEWRKKQLETFAGSYAELKHDTVLYSKQVMAEMGGDEIPVYDDRGYVEPEPEVYSRFAVLSQKTAEGLSNYGMISEDDINNLNNLAELAKQLMVISEKELVNETLTDEEYDLIRAYGGNLEHFWYDAIKNQADTEYVTTEEFPAAIVVDIATDPNGSVLEVATGGPSVIYVVVPVDGELKVAVGSCYEFYQFEQPISDRMTDSSWRQAIGKEVKEDGTYNWNPDIPQPSWTDSYRGKYEY